MAWVRYDDQFPINGKVGAVIAEDPGALSLQLLANTWSNTTKFPGYIPPHQPGVLLADRSLASKWTDLLVRTGMFHVRGQECGACREEYAGLPAECVDGFVIHNARHYRPPGRDRVAPGTSAELSAKRREAGRRGGQAAAASRRASNGQQMAANLASAAFATTVATANPAANVDGLLVDGKQNAASAVANGGEDPAAGLPPAETPTEGLVGAVANGVSKASNLLEQSVSPDPVPDSSLASYEARAPRKAARKRAAVQQSLDDMPAKPDPAVSNEDLAHKISREWVAERARRGSPVVVDGNRDPQPAVQRSIRAWLDHYSENEVKRALVLADKGIPTKQQMETALARLRGGSSDGGRHPMRVQNTHEIDYSADRPSDRRRNRRGSSTD